MNQQASDYIIETLHKKVATQEQQIKALKETNKKLRDFRHQVRKALDEGQQNAEAPQSISIPILANLFRP